jgi:hypothetical protein
MTTFFHADPLVRQTRGRRGKTTGRASTRTIRGPEGSYIADVKEELATRDQTRWVVLFERAWIDAADSVRETKIYTYVGRYETRERAEEVAAGLKPGVEHKRYAGLWELDPGGRKVWVDTWEYVVRAWVEVEQ